MDRWGLLQTWSTNNTAPKIWDHKPIVTTPWANTDPTPDHPRQSNQHRRRRKICRALHPFSYVIDGIANVLGKAPGAGRKLLGGSHLESQNHAGWLDGPLGVIYGLEAARALVEDPATANVPVDVVSFADEEGHFGFFLGSRSLAGTVTEADIDAGETAQAVDLESRQPHPVIASRGDA